MEQHQDKIIVFYDGDCGLCHGFVLFVLTRDTEARFVFAPLQGETFQQLVSEEARANVPDSIVILTEKGELLIRSTGVVHVLRAIGGPWGVAGMLLQIAPRFLRDLGYRLVARVRKRIFKKPRDVCPIVPSDLRGRFLA